ncbi:MAG: glycosyltransferase family 4 protein [bacterium]|nr:glycosyltransferase family 4 protein [bacterium]
MASFERPKITYVLPEFNLDTDSHFFHLYDLLDVAGKELDCQVIVERGWLPKGTLSSHYRLQRWQWFPARVIELTILLAYQRLRGRRWFYIHYSFVGALAAWFVARLFGGTVYYWNCGMPWLYHRPWLKERVFQFILRHTILVTGTPGMAEAYRHQYGLRADRIRVMPNWINTSRYVGGLTREVARQRLGIPSDRKVVLFVHRLSRRKGAHLIIETAATVTKQFENVMFFIVGHGPEYARIESQIREASLGERVQLVGGRPHRTVPHYFAAADLFFMPSEEEGFPHVLLEAMAYGLPYVASTIGGVREITPPALQPFLTPAGDVARFVERISAMLAMTADECGRLSAEEWAWVRRYDLSEVLPQFLALFRST